MCTSAAAALEAVASCRLPIVCCCNPPTPAGCCNLLKHIQNTRKFGIPVVVCINRFASDTDAELEAVRAAALAGGAEAAVVCTHHGEGGAGAVELAKAVQAACARSDTGNFRVRSGGLPRERTRARTQWPFVL